MLIALIIGYLVRTGKLDAFRQRLGFKPSPTNSTLS